MVEGARLALDSTASQTGVLLHKLSLDMVPETRIELVLAVFQAAALPTELFWLGVPGWI